jgi:hypothetical protein
MLTQCLHTQAPTVSQGRSCATGCHGRTGLVLPAHPVQEPHALPERTPTNPAHMPDRRLSLYLAALTHISQHSTAQHSTAQHSTAQHSTAQHSTAQHWSPHRGCHHTVCAPTSCCCWRGIADDVVQKQPYTPVRLHRGSHQRHSFQQHNGCMQQVLHSLRLLASPCGTSTATMEAEALSNSMPAQLA